MATLLATAAYQACLSPPGGVEEDGPSEGLSRLSILDPGTFILFLIFNSAGFFVNVLDFCPDNQFPMAI